MFHLIADKRAPDFQTARLEDPCCEHLVTLLLVTEDRSSPTWCKSAICTSSDLPEWLEDADTQEIHKNIPLFGTSQKEPGVLIMMNPCLCCILEGVLYTILVVNNGNECIRVLFYGVTIMYSICI